MSLSTAKEQRYLVLDLDSTILWSQPKNLMKEFIEHERIFYLKPLATSVLFQVIVRKHLRHFLDQAHSRGYKVIVWTAGEETYGKAIESILFKEYNIDYLFTREHCRKEARSDEGHDYYKELNRIKNFIPGFVVENCRLIDDSERHKLPGQEHLVHLVKEFITQGELPTEQEDDDLLLTLMDEVELTFK